MRKQTLELLQLEIMNQRGILKKDELVLYKQLETGFQGEIQFDQ